MKNPIGIPTRETAEFVASHVSPSATILEVGCGRGHLARELKDRGYRVLALDASEEAVAEAQELGVEAVEALWPEFECDAVDAVAFTRSLHHIGSLAPALVKARELMSPDGILLIEDFAFDELNAPTLAWFLEVLHSRAGTALINLLPGEVVTELLGAEDPPAFWRQRHDDHGVHRGAAMTRAVEECFVARETRAVPYLYRYLIRVLPETAEATTFVEETFREEARRGELEEIVLIGRRTVAHPRDRQAPFRT